MGSEQRARALRSSQRETKRLVAHYEWGWQRQRGIHDGDPVAPCAPCPRLRAGYWCADCGEGFGRDHDDPNEFIGVQQARIEVSPNGAGTRYLEDEHSYSYHGGAATSEEAHALQQQIQALPVGTIVERFGLGIAPRFIEQGLGIGSQRQAR